MEIRILLIFLLAFVVAKAQHMSAPVSDKFPYRAGILMDGGSFYILENAANPELPFTMLFDHGLSSKTKGELFLVSQKGREKQTPAQAEKLFTAIEQKLLAFHGKTTLAKLMKEPIDWNAEEEKIEKMPEEEAEAHVLNPEFANRMVTQQILGAISMYRKSHLTKPQ